MTFFSNEGTNAKKCIGVKEAAIYNIENGHEESMVAYKNKEDDVFKCC